MARTADPGRGRAGLTAVPLVRLPQWAAALVNVAAAIAVHVGAGYAAHRWPLHRLQEDGPLLRIRPWEQGGRWYERVLHIKRWKDRVPEAGAVFAGGTSKRALGRLDADGLWRFAAETRRAERSHWLAMVVGPLAMIWNPWAGMIAMWCYALFVNLPFVAIQRYNRARIKRTLARAA